MIIRQYYGLVVIMLIQLSFIDYIQLNAMSPNILVIPECVNYPMYDIRAHNIVCCILVE